MFLVTHVLQYLLLPFLLHQSFAALVANTLHATGAICYTYVTHLGYRSMFFSTASAFSIPHQRHNVFVGVNCRTSIEYDTNFPLGVLWLKKSYVIKQNNTI